MKATIVLTAAAVFVAIPAYAGSTNGNKPATAPGASGLTPGYQLNSTTPRPAQGASSFAPGIKQFDRGANTPALPGGASGLAPGHRR